MISYLLGINYGFKRFANHDVEGLWHIITLKLAIAGRRWLLQKETPSQDRDSPKYPALGANSFALWVCKISVVLPIKLKKEKR